MPEPITFKEDRPIYLQIAEQLRGEISDETLKVGSDFPSDKQLREIYRIARGTAQQVRSVLEREKLIQRRRGKRHVIVKKPKKRQATKKS